MQKIALLGLGNMGSGIALSLLRSGSQLAVWNRSREKGQPVLEAGAVWAVTPAEAAQNADIVIAMLADDTASREVWLGERGALRQMKPGAFVIECSTLSLKYVKELSAAAAAGGLRYIDCPVTGIPDAAAQGKLTLLVGADAADLEACRTILQTFSATIRYFGNIGTGTMYKLIINLMGAVQIAGLAEGIAMAEKLGLNRNEVMAAMEDSAAASPQVVRYVRKMGEKKFAGLPAFTVQLRHKDAVYALDLAKEAGFDPKLGAVAKEWFAKALGQFAARDEAYVIEAVTNG
ncbi:MAG: NAD(P)-dependent oxidoreductase [Chitinophagaceae bacterium]|nr:NAD(P)-dependent oxidoreductase [Chitinophagaceae bacterium]